MATDFADAALMQKFKGVLAEVHSEIAAVKSRYANTPGPHFTEADWSCVEEEARFYIWLYLNTHDLGVPDLVPGTVVEIAMQRTQEVRDAGGTAVLMERHNRLMGALNV